MQKGAVRSLNDIVTRRDDLKAVQASLNDMGAALKEQQARADAARAQLKQPDDLKAVYDKAYEKTVSLPADTFRDVLPQLNATFDSSLKIADYVEAHKAQIEISGAIVKVQDPAVQAELNQMLQDLNAQAKNLQQAHTRMQALMLGR
jgi:DNA repair ATPase RecN